MLFLVRTRTYTQGSNEEEAVLCKAFSGPHLLTRSTFSFSSVYGRTFPVAGLPSDVTSAPSLLVFRNQLNIYFAAVMILYDHILYPHWFGYYFFLHSGPCDSLHYLGHFINISWLIDWLICKSSFIALTLLVGSFGQ